MSLRVSSGKFKGHRLKDVPGNTTRPVTEKVKLAIFNIIGNEVEESKWWDVFGGTGAIGIEALSRGASYVLFCEINNRPLQILKDNIQSCGFFDQADVIRINAFTKLSSPPNQSFDFIYLAPPQYLGYWLKALHALDSNPGWLAEEGNIIIQIHPVEDTLISLKNFNRFDERRYGSTKLIFYQKNG